MCCFNKVNLSAILLIHKRTINKDCTVKNNNNNNFFMMTDVTFVLECYVFILF